MNTRLISTLTIGAIIALTAAGCASTHSTPSGQAPAATGDTTTELDAKLLTLDEIPTGGWAITPDDTSSSPETSTDKNTDDSVCGGDLTSVFDVDTDSTASISFERRGVTFNESLAPADNPEDVVTQIEAAVSECYGQPKETTLNGQPATIEFSPLPTTGIDGTATGYVVSATLNYVQHDLPFYIVAGDGLIVLTGIVPAAGENITPEEFAQLTQAAADTAH